MSSHATLRDTDFHAWANQQAALLRAGRISEADVQNIAEEIESMGRSEKRELVNRLTVLFVHSLKWRRQPASRGHSRRRTIEQRRLHLEDHLADNPSLKSHLPAAIERSYRHALTDAEHETGILKKDFPPACPFSFDQARDPEFWPD